MIKEIFKNWKNTFVLKNKYYTRSRYPFYDIAAKYLPSNKNALIIDIGSGIGGFVNHANIRYKR